MCIRDREKTAPLEENESLRNIAAAYVKVTRKEVANVLGQLAAADVDGRVYPIKDVYRRTMDYVFREVSSLARKIAICPSYLVAKPDAQTGDTYAIPQSGCFYGNFQLHQQDVTFFNGRLCLPDVFGTQ